MLLAMFDRHRYIQGEVSCSLIIYFLIPYIAPTHGRTELIQVRLERALYSSNYMRYCDIPSEPCHEQDPFMDRIVPILWHKREVFKDRGPWGEVIATGVYINKNHVLSSYNPFRDLRKRVKREKMRVYYYLAKWLRNGNHSGYMLRSEKISCARQVVPMTHHTEEQWHGPDHRHSPVHDLIVFKTAANMTMNTTWTHLSKNDSFLYSDEKNLMTEIARPGERLSSELKFASVGFLDDDHIENRNHLHTVELTRRGRVVNCDEWFIRDWGYFICIKNDDGYVGIGSGALLFSRQKVFGVGSFALHKGNESILVFTDVRPYYSEIFRTCTVSDGHGP